MSCNGKTEPFPSMLRRNHNQTRYPRVVPNRSSIKNQSETITDTDTYTDTATTVETRKKAAKTVIKITQGTILPRATKAPQAFQIQTAEPLHSQKMAKYE